MSLVISAGSVSGFLVPCLRSGRTLLLSHPTRPAWGGDKALLLGLPSVFRHGAAPLNTWRKLPSLASLLIICYCFHKWAFNSNVKINKGNLKLQLEWERLREEAPLCQWPQVQLFSSPATGPANENTAAQPMRSRGHLTSSLAEWTRLFFLPRLYGTCPYCPWRCLPVGWAAAQSRDHSQPTSPHI